MMAVVLSAATGYFTVPALRIVGRRLIDVERLLGILMREAPGPPWRMLAGVFVEVDMVLAPC
jgi:hypothetical protein